MTSTDYLLPELPSGSSQITIVRWLKAPGQRLSAGEPLLVVVNDRFEVALPATCDGILERALAAEGVTLALGIPAATIALDTVPSATDALNVALSATPTVEPSAGPTPSAQEFAARALRISPVAQRIADTVNIDITNLRGSGISGRIMKADILATLAHPLTRSPAHPLTRSPAHFGGDTYVLTAIDVDMGRVLDAVARLAPVYARRRLELSYSACVARAVVAVLPDHPLLNSSWRGDTIVTRRRVHLLAVPRGGPPGIQIRDAQDLNLRGLARGLSRAGAAVANTSDDSTFTIADLGAQFWADPAALACGRSAALGIGAVRAQPLVLDDDGVDRVALRQVALLTLAYDARALDQCHADAFLRDLKRRLEHFDP